MIRKLLQQLKHALLIIALCTVTPVSAQTVQIISTEAAGGCLVAEMVIDGTLVGHALEARGGPLSRLRTGRYKAKARFVKPDSLWLSGPGPDVIVTKLTVAGGDADAKSTAERYRDSMGRDVPYDLSLAPAISPDSCARTVSAIPKLSDWQKSVVFEKLFAGAQESKSIPGTYERDLELEIRRPLDIKFSIGDHVLVRNKDVWKEFSGKRLIAEYDEFERNLSGFDLRDRKPAEISFFGKTTTTPRIVHVPSGFNFWTTGFGARTNVTVYRPTEGILLESPVRLETNLYQTSIVAKSFIKRIITDPIVSGQPMSANNAARLGFDDLVGGRVQALELALLTDALFSELPQNGSQSAEDFRLWSSFGVSMSCNGSFVNSYRYDPPLVAFGKEGPLQAPGRLVEPIKEQVSRSEGRVQSVTIEYTTMGRPHALALPSFNLIKPRSCTWIWHRISVDLSCIAGVPKVQADVDGSDFPSHKLWVNEADTRAIEQQAFDRLWVCKPGEPEVVN